MIFCERNDVNEILVMLSLSFMEDFSDLLFFATEDSHFREAFPKVPRSSPRHVQIGVSG